MLKKYIGKNRAENLDWLLKVWLQEGPPVCFLQGFSGVGKTDLARDFRELAEKQGKWQQVVINEIADRPTPSVLESLMELSATLSQQGLVEMETVLFESPDPNLAYAVEKALQRPVVIILDEAQRFFHADSGAPLPEMNGILTFLRNRPTLRGRLLLLSDRIVEEARWSEWIPKRTLTKLAPDEGIEALETKMKEADVADEILEDRKKEVVRFLDCNPRALEALVGALRYESLDEIIGSNPGLWAVRDRDISRDFLRALERDLLERTMRHLDATHQKKLRLLAVHRRSFKRDALERLCKTKDEAAELRSILLTRFLLNFYRGVLALNPIVREIALFHLRDTPAEFRQAHSRAADYHLRHFKAKQIVGTQEKLGEAFAELRYHLVQSGRKDELHDIGHRFTDHLKHEIKAGTPVPTDLDELNERIGILTVLLQHEDPSRRGAGEHMGLRALLLINENARILDYHLAQCLRSRAEPGDIQQAVIHAERALDPAHPASWHLLVSLTLQAEGSDAALAVIDRALRGLKDPDAATPLSRVDETDEAPVLLSIASLHRLGAETLIQAGKTEDAIALLKEGIKIIPPDKGLSSFYHFCGELLGKAGKSEEAVMLLKEGIKVIPQDQNPLSLYRLCGEMLGKAGKPEEAVMLLKEGIKVISQDQNPLSLYHLCGEILGNAGKPEEAVTLLKEGIKVIPPEKSLYSLYCLCGEILGNAGKPEEAVTLLKEGIKVILPDQNLFSLYQMLSQAFCRAAKHSDAIAAQQEGLGRIPEQFGRYKLVEGVIYLFAGRGDSAALSKFLSGKTGGAVGRQQVALGNVLLREIQGDWEGAADAAGIARREFPNYFALACAEAFSCLGAGNPGAAWEALGSFPNLVSDRGKSGTWLAAFIHLRRGARADASAALAHYLARPVNENRELNESFLLRLWDGQEVVPEGHWLCFHFPIMPASLTGLNQDVRRLTFAEPVLPVHFTPHAGVRRPQSVSASLARAPEVFVSYAWGEDSTLEGRQREEIVDLLCEAVRASGREVGRDKERLRGGDSIERFAQEISKAKRIIAVISAKSLHSSFCMAHELFRAYRRCDYQRAEFQEKVIALVMDDAKPFLKDDFAWISLAKHWNAKLEQLRHELQVIDPNRKSHGQWIFADLMGEMVPRLPDMLAALADIVMKRGFGEIVAAGFQEVIRRLPNDSKS